MLRIRSSLVLAALSAGCRIHGVPDLPADRDAARSTAPIPTYQPPADIFGAEVYVPPADRSTGMKGMHHGARDMEAVPGVDEEAPGAEPPGGVP